MDARRISRSWSTSPGTSAHKGTHIVVFYDRIAGTLEDCAETVRTIVGHAKVIEPGVEHINATGGVVAGALPLLYGMAEEIVADVTPAPERPEVPEPVRPASGRRRSRLQEAVGFAPPQ